MSAHSTEVHATAGSTAGSIVGSVAGFWPRLSVRGLLSRLLDADALYRQRADLSRLDDHMLRDIGVTRADVDREIRRPLPFW